MFNSLRSRPHIDAVRYSCLEGVTRENAMKSRGLPPDRGKSDGFLLRLLPPDAQLPKNCPK